MSLRIYRTHGSIARPPVAAQVVRAEKHGVQTTSDKLRTGAHRCACSSMLSRFAQRTRVSQRTMTGHARRASRSRRMLGLPRQRVS